jgi:hypothetical protein
MKKLLSLLFIITLTSPAWAKSDSLERLGDEMARFLDGEAICIRNFDHEKVTRRHFRDYQVAENKPNWFKARYEVPTGFSSGYVQGYLMYNPVTLGWACGSLTDNIKHDKKLGITGWDDASGTDVYKAFNLIGSKQAAIVSVSSPVDEIYLTHKHHKVTINPQAGTLTLVSKGKNPFRTLHLLNDNQQLDFGFQTSNDWYKPKGSKFVYFQTNGLKAQQQGDNAVIKLNDQNILNRLVTSLGANKYLYLAVRQSGKKGFLIARVKR